MTLDIISAPTKLTLVFISARSFYSGFCTGVVCQRLIEIVTVFEAVQCSNAQYHPCETENVGNTINVLHCLRMSQFLHQFLYKSTCTSRQLFFAAIYSEKKEKWTEYVRAAMAVYRVSRTAGQPKRW